MFTVVRRNTYGGPVPDNGPLIIHGLLMNRLLILYIIRGWVSVVTDGTRSLAEKRRQPTLRRKSPTTDDGRITVPCLNRPHKGRGSGDGVKGQRTDPTSMLPVSTPSVGLRYSCLQASPSRPSMFLGPGNCWGNPTHGRGDDDRNAFFLLGVHPKLVRHKSKQNASV